MLLMKTYYQQLVYYRDVTGDQENIRNSHLLGGDAAAEFQN